MLQNSFSIRQFRLTKWSFFVHSTTCTAPYIHPSHDSILELWRSFPNVIMAFVLQTYAANVPLSINKQTTIGHSVKRYSDGPMMARNCMAAGWWKPMCFV